MGITIRNYRILKHRKELKMSPGIILSEVSQTLDAFIPSILILLNISRHHLHIELLTNVSQLTLCLLITRFNHVFKNNTHKNSVHVLYYFLLCRRTNTTIKMHSGIISNMCDSLTQSKIFPISSRK